MTYLTPRASCSCQRGAGGARAEKEEGELPFQSSTGSATPVQVGCVGVFSEGSFQIEVSK